MEVDCPKQNFIVFESLSSESQKIFYVINTDGIEDGPNIKIGRGGESDVRVTDDISVSRSHAYIEKNSNGEYYIVDNHSKFGTLMLVQYPIFIDETFQDKPLVLQSGKTYLELKIQPPTR